MSKRTLNFENEEIRIYSYPCEDCENPLEANDYGLYWHLKHRRYNFYNSKELEWTSDFDNILEIKEEVKRKYKGCTIFDVYMYEHGGISLSTSRHPCKFDSGLLGFLVVPKKLKDTMKDDDEVDNYVTSILEEYNNYINGYIYNVDVMYIDTCPHCDTVIENIAESTITSDVEDTVKMYIKEYTEYFSDDKDTRVGQKV